MLLTEKALIVSLAVSKNCCATQMKKETNIAELETGWVVPRLYVHLHSSMKHGQVIMTVVTSLPIQEGHLVNPVVLQALLKTAGSLSFVEQLHIWVFLQAHFCWCEIMYLHTFWLRILHASSIQGQAIHFCFRRIENKTGWGCKVSKLPHTGKLYSNCITP